MLKKMIDVVDFLHITQQMMRALRVVLGFASLSSKPARVSSSLIWCPIHSALCHIEAKTLSKLQLTDDDYIIDVCLILPKKRFMIGSPQ